MRRFFGAAAEKPTTMSLGDHDDKLNDRISLVQDDLTRTSAELETLKARLRVLRPNSAEYTTTRRRAEQLLKRRNMLTRQIEQMYGQQSNVQHVAFAAQNLKDNVMVVDSMKVANKTLKSEMAKVDIDEVWDIREDLEESMADADEIGDLLGRSFELGTNIDESTLDAELDALGNELYAEPAPLVPGISASSFPAVASDERPSYIPADQPVHARYTQPQPAAQPARIII